MKFCVYLLKTALLLTLLKMSPVSAQENLADFTTGKYFPFPKKATFAGTWVAEGDSNDLVTTVTFEKFHHNKNGFDYYRDEAVFKILKLTRAGLDVANQFKVVRVLVDNQTDYIGFPLEDPRSLEGHSLVFKRLEDGRVHLSVHIGEWNFGNGKKPLWPVRGFYLTRKKPVGNP
ncbi:MAG: hypothetical protein EOP48_32250 [Sphingobacteriales bacterium]|nr:MAG: hypothetical protein EOP48_32250 [Sphingobacteriales bacterium]